VHEQRVAQPRARLDRDSRPYDIASNYVVVFFFIANVMERIFGHISVELTKIGDFGKITRSFF